jgi:sulfite exporter TauE/SafE
VSPLVPGAFFMGLLGGAHCVAMCGGVVGVFCSAASSCQARAGARIAALPMWLAYHAGRLASYTVLGLAFASFAALTTDPDVLDAIRYGLRSVAALAMLAVGLHLLGLPSILAGAERLGGSLWRRVAPLSRRLVPVVRARQAFALGALWGLMPCGLLYGALALAASAESTAEGGLVMAAFGAGTLPALVTMSALAQAVARIAASRAPRRIAGALVLAFGLWSTAGVAKQTGLSSVFGGPAVHHCCPGR